MIADRRSPAWLAAQAGHLAVWLGLYFTAAYIAAALTLGRNVSISAIFACFYAGVGLYLLDRVKVRNAWLDPADRLAQPGRYDFLLAHRGLVRIAAWVVLALGTLAAAATNPRNLALPPIGITGVILYSTLHTNGTRLKDLLVVKNLLPGLAIAGLAVIFAWQSPTTPLPHALTPGPGGWPVLGVLVGLVLLVTADTMLCDLDDMAIDAAHSTRTVPTVLGQAPTWIIALVLHALAGGLLIASGLAAEIMTIAAWIAGGNLVATVALFVLRPDRLRDLVDLKLPMVVGLVWVLV